MASLTDRLKTLIGFKTGDEVLDDAYQKLLALGSALTNWNPGGFTRTVLTVAARIFGEFYLLLLSVVEQGYLATATGSWLDMRAADQGLLRHAASSTKGDVAFSREAAGPAVPIPKNTIVATQLDSEGERRRFWTTEDAVLGINELSVDVAVEAESPGTEYNVAATLINAVLTPIPGIDAVSNAVGWITSEGTDDETDDDLRERCLLRWAELSRGAIADAYKSWALAVSGVEGVSVLDNFPRGPGTVDVVITSTAGMPSAELIAEVQEYIDARRPICADVLVKAPTGVGVALTVTLKAAIGSDLALIQAEAVELLEAWFVKDEENPDIEPLGPGDDLVVAKLTALLMDIDDVEDVAWTSPATNVSANLDELVYPTAMSVVVEEVA